VSSRAEAHAVARVDRADPIRSPRGLLILVAAGIFVESLFYSALAPLLPGLKEELGLTTSQAGVLGAMYALGITLAVLPASGLKLLIGAKWVVAAGLAILVPATVAFGVGNTYTWLVVARLMQGVGAAGLWIGGLVWLVEAGPRERRGEMVGVVLSAGAAGEIAGPTLGGVAAAIGLAPTFAATAGLVGLLGLAVLGVPSPARGGPMLQGRAASAHALISPVAWLPAVPVMLMGVLSVLGPLQMADLGWAATGTAVTFALAAFTAVLVQPLVGRWSDRHGRLPAIRCGLLGSFAMLVALAVSAGRWSVPLLVIVALTAAGVAWGPVMTLLSDRCEAAGIGQTLAVGIAQLTGTLGFVAGSAGAAAIAQASGRSWAYAVVAGLTLAVVAVIARASESPGKPLPP
jgi:MFS family permease